MIHHVEDRKLRDEDQLAAAVIRELQKLDIRAAVIHSSTIKECYSATKDKAGKTVWIKPSHKRGKLIGYVRNIALNKVLLLNQVWPFVLASEPHADVVIGIDVKAHTAGFVVVGGGGRSIRWLYKTSNQKEQLATDRVRSTLCEILRQEFESRREALGKIVIQRDGILYDCEAKGMNEAVTQLKSLGIVKPDAWLTLIEIPKHPKVPLRLFKETPRASGFLWVENPEVGDCFEMSDREGFVCATGRSYLKQGTALPLSVRIIDGPQPIGECLEDVFYLSSLAWTKPDDCSRYPITVRLNDRFLRDAATAYDAHALEEEAVA